MTVGAWALGWKYLTQSQRSPWTLFCMLGAWLAITASLFLRGIDKGCCPLGGLSNNALFCSWTLMSFYLLIGSVYRLSLLGFFTAPLATLFVLIALFVPPSNSPAFFANQPPMQQAHIAFAFLSYGAFGMASVASAMFLIVEKRLKNPSAQNPLFLAMPPIMTLSVLIVRLLFLGLFILSLAIFLGFFTQNHLTPHGVISLFLWLGYALILFIFFQKGIPPRRLSHSVLALFILALVSFL